MGVNAALQHITGIHTALAKYRCGRERIGLMRIVAGELRGRAIRTPEGQGVRPTSDRARQAVFNILEHAPWSVGIEGRRVIDLFAGSGALGLEALSRGALKCLFVELSETSLAAVRANIRAFEIEERTRLVRQDAMRLGARHEGRPLFDIAFLDPPYAKGLAEPALQALRTGRWLAPGAIAVLEQGAGEAPLEPEGFEVLDRRRYGAAQVSFLKLG
jgi:16S rRNA (guanine966-N2)-methyltransferase